MTKRITVRNIDDMTYSFLEIRAKEMSSEGHTISVNQLIGFILNQYQVNHLIRHEVSEIKKINDRLDNLCDILGDLVLSKQEI